MSFGNSRDELIKRYYPRLDKATLEMILGLTWRQISHRANTLNVRRDSDVANNSRLYIYRKKNDFFLQRILDILNMNRALTVKELSMIMNAENNNPECHYPASVKTVGFRPTILVHYLRMLRYQKKVKYIPPQSHKEKGKWGIA